MYDVLKRERFSSCKSTLPNTTMPSRLRVASGRTDNPPPVSTTASQEYSPHLGGRYRLPRILSRIDTYMAGYYPPPPQVSSSDCVRAGSRLRQGAGVRTVVTIGGSRGAERGCSGHRGLMLHHATGQWVLPPKLVRQPRPRLKVCQSAFRLPFEVNRHTQPTLDREVVRPRGLR